MEAVEYINTQGKTEVLGTALTDDAKCMGDKFLPLG